MEAEKAYAALLSEGKITPAQRDLYFAAAASHGAVSLSDGSKKSTFDLVNAMLKAGPKVVSFEEIGKEVSGDQSRPFAKLADESKQILEKYTSIKPEEYDKLAEMGKF